MVVITPNVKNAKYEVSQQIYKSKICIRNKINLPILMRDSVNLRNVESFVDEQSDIYRRCNPREAIQIVAPLQACFTQII